MVKTTLANALAQLHDIVSFVEQQQDAGLPIDDLDVPFQDASVSLQDAVDRRAHVLKSLASQIERAKESAQWWQTKAKYLTAALERLEKATLDLGVEQLQGHNSMIKVCTNGGKQPVKFKEEFLPYSIPRVVNRVHYPEEYLEKHEVFILKKDFEDDIRSGKIDSQAAYIVVRGKHLRLS